MRSRRRCRGIDWVPSGPGCFPLTPAALDDLALSLTAKGLTSGEIASPLAQIYGMTTTKETISTIRAG